MNHIDIDDLCENYAWAHFRDIQSVNKIRQDEFKKLERDDCEFVINRKGLVIINQDPEYSDFNFDGAKPCTLFKSIYTNNTNRPQAYSFKTERTTESFCAVQREQGYTIGTEVELTLKTPCEIAELKTGFKHEMHFNNLRENAITELLTWGVDSNVNVPPHYSTEASILIEEMNYRGSYTVNSTLQGFVVISIRRLKFSNVGTPVLELTRIPYPNQCQLGFQLKYVNIERRDNALVLPVRVNIAEVFKYSKVDVDKKCTIAHNKVLIVSKGKCHFQFAMKQSIDLKETALATAPREVREVREIPYYRYNTKF